MTSTQLGRFTVDDVDYEHTRDVLGTLSNPSTVRYLGLKPLRRPQDAMALISRYRAGPARWLAVSEGAAFVGLVGLEVQGHQVTITLVSNGLRIGFGREFSRPLIAWIFSQPQVWRLWSYVHVDNIAGQRVTERLGATKEGRLRRFAFFPNVSETEPQDVFVYSITRDDLR